MYKMHYAHRSYKHRAAVVVLQLFFHIFSLSTLQFIISSFFFFFFFFKSRTAYRNFNVICASPCRLFTRSLFDAETSVPLPKIDRLESFVARRHRDSVIERMSFAITWNSTRRRGTTRLVVSLVATCISVMHNRCYVAKPVQSN